MRKPVGLLMALLVAAVPLAGGLAAVVYAADLCLAVNKGEHALNVFSTGIVLKRVTAGTGAGSVNKELAKANKCRVLGALTFGPHTTDPSPPHSAAGPATVCTTGDKTTALVSLTDGVGTSFKMTVPLPLPTTAGTARVTLADGTIFEDATVTAAVCTPTVVPIAP
jgi:hypothetical protein